MRTIYVDTSVFGGVFDEEFSKWSRLFFERVISSDIRIILSEMAEDELFGAPSQVIDHVKTLPKKNLIRANLNAEAATLAHKYIEAKVVGASSLVDCQHIALATVMNADLLVSWNFKHIVNIERIHGYNAINLICGYHILEIRNPREAFDYGES